MNKFMELFELASGKTLSPEQEASTHRLQLVVRATLVSVGFAAFYGLAAGSTDLGIALGNLYKVPMVILLSTLCALPIGLLSWKLLGGTNRASDLLLGVASGNFTASLVLAALAPIVALYYHTSGHLGGVLAMSTASIAVLLGFLNVARTVWNRRPKVVELVNLPGLLVPVAVMIFAQQAALLQFIHVASPILPEVTVFDGGADEMLGR